MTADYRGRPRSAIPSTIWPGFVDALTGVLLVLIFTISTFVIVQFLLRGELTGQGQELELAESRISTLLVRLDEAVRRGDRLQQELELTAANSLEREADVERLLRETAEAKTQALVQREEYEAALERLKTELQDERARVEEARAQASERLQSLREVESAAQGREATLRAALDAERGRTEDALAQLKAREAALESLSEPLEEATRQRAELVEQVALLSDRLDAETESRRAREEEVAFERQRVAGLNEQTQELREQILQLQGMLRASELRDEENQTVIRNLGQRLNSALAQQVGELSRFRSEFFGRMREALGDRDDIRIVGDRFVFESGVLFASASAQIGEEGKADLAAVSDALFEITNQIPDDIDWLVRVDGHTDSLLLRSGSLFQDNWELSQARALAVVRFFVEERGLPPERFAAAGFGEFRPVDPGDTPEAHARNRRMEITLTSR